MIPLEPIRIIVADDEPGQRSQLISALSSNDRITVVGEASDGLEALSLLATRHPQVLVCDMVMPRMDGFALLEHLAGIPHEDRPGFIAQTALCRDDFIMRAIGLGAAYYMLKPVNVEQLIEQILCVAGAGPMPASPKPASQPEENGQERLDKYVTSLLLQIGMPAHMNGYKYLRQAIMTAIERPDVLDCVSRDLYPAIAQACDTTASRVERSIRHAIAVTWDRAGSAAFNKMLGRYVGGCGEKPTNCEFIALMAERIRIHLSHR
ncbi:MAG: sporulation transcription factor Spo0A [Aristaeellaceae bacterium]